MNHEEWFLDAYATMRMLGIDSMWRVLNGAIERGDLTRWDAQSIAEKVRQRIDKAFPKGHKFF